MGRLLEDVWVAAGKDPVPKERIRKDKEDTILEAKAKESYMKKAIVFSFMLKGENKKLKVFKTKILGLEAKVKLKQRLDQLELVLAFKRVLLHRQTNP